MRDLTGALGAFGTVRGAQPMAALTTFKIGGAADYVLTVRPERLPQALAYLRESGVPVLMLGNGSNLLVSDGGVSGVVLRLDAGAEPAVEGTRVVCPAGQTLAKVCLAAREHGLAGLEFAYGIPGTVGGALYMNAGAYGGAMADVVESADAVGADGARYTLAAADMALGYRHSAFMRREGDVIERVTLRLREGDRAEIAAWMQEYTRRRREKQPLDLPSAGSYFKRPAENIFAGALIERCGMKGHRIGDAAVSDKHAGFVVNLGAATCADVLRLEEAVRERVFAREGIVLQREVRYIGV